MKFKKAPAYVGKSLKLYVGGGDRPIADDEELEGAYWQKFADQGFLVPVEEEAPAPAPVKPKAKVAPAKAPEPAPEPEKAPEPAPEPEKAPEPPPEEPKGTMTKSTADKMAKAQGSKGKSASTKPKSKRRKK